MHEDLRRLSKAPDWMLPMEQNEENNDICKKYADHQDLSKRLILTSNFTCKQMAVFTLQPNEVETARGLRPSAENSLLKLVVNAIRGLSSATTTHVLTHARLTPRALRA